jgi:Uma2 family endonuclease
MRYTWADYLTWNTGERWEIVAGEAFAISPAPTPRHQGIVVQLTRQFAQQLEGRPCRVFCAPIDVKLSEEDVVQPDVAIVCTPDRVTPTHVKGAPDLVVEVLSPSTALFDRTRKMRLYAAAGVREVWLVTPYPWLAEVFVLDAGSYRLAGCWSRLARAPSTVLPGLVIDLAPVFDFPLEPGEEIKMVREGSPTFASRAGQPA